MTLVSLLEQLRELRHTWNVDTDPATRTAADHIIATLAAAELSIRDSESPTAVE
ncbi:hypothetical protein ACFWPX_08990 [Nocardia sp. NPDC058518]|uniref:hypothetical protein n=1 Tax=Nocardia sp. NPDC058518 TaxID=3346534 RepID=UPI003666EA43